MHHRAVASVPNHPLCPSIANNLLDIRSLASDCASLIISGIAQPVGLHSNQQVPVAGTGMGRSHKFAGICLFPLCLSWVWPDSANGFIVYSRDVTMETMLRQDQPDGKAIPTLHIVHDHKDRSGG